VLKALVKDADVLVENYRPDVKFRLGIDYESLKPVNTRLVYASISGFGQTGPYRDRPGVDQIAQGMGGLMSVTGLPGQGPVRVGVPIADLTAGIFAAMGILIALLEREESGEGQFVESSLLSAQIAMLDFQATRWTVGKEVAPQAGNNHPTNIPSGVFRTTDGHINIASAGQEMFSRFCRASGLGSLTTDPDFATPKARYKNRDKLNAIMEDVTATKSSAEWIDIMNRAGVPCGPIYRMNEVFADPQVQHLGIVQPVEHPSLGRLDLIGQAVTLSRTPSQLRSATPERGEHTDAVLRELGYDGDTVARFRRDGVV
jgi:crotonobetainyl-CoA:carnitine CoA-transferase CaiB-like acyl-CoA transferase